MEILYPSGDLDIQFIAVASLTASQKYVYPECENYLIINNETWVILKRKKTNQTLTFS